MLDTRGNPEENIKLHAKWIPPPPPSENHDLANSRQTGGELDRNDQEQRFTVRSIVISRIDPLY